MKNPVGCPNWSHAGYGVSLAVTPWGQRYWLANNGVHKQAYWAEQGEYSSLADPTDEQLRAAYQPACDYARDRCR